ncbi:uncharacterized protein LOC129571855 [Sitodiplosis mosellana]|uniref:uncharacterized protein LOC129571855 n=1 Tax=Sitodiplosis mosellana TaxID=263140 RepID=UPI00244393CE|nr:uncharacterized protein LOC129571855 [Sitodiplosis mosellana]
MKFFSAILVAVVCATVVSAAPSTKNDLASIIDDLKDNAHLNCIHNVVGKVVGDSELKGKWTETKIKIDALRAEWAKCLKMDDPQQHKCMVAVIKKGADVASDFVKTLANEKYLPLLKQIAEKVLAECFNGAIGEEVKEKLRQKVKCVIYGITEAVKGTTFAPVWEEYFKHLVDLNERIKACARKPSQVDVARCIVGELKKDESIHRKFFEELKKVSKEEFVRVAKYIKGKCFQ